MDIQILLFFQSLREATGGAFDGFVTAFSDLVINPVVYVILAGVFWSVDKRLGGVLITNVIIGSNINQTAKNIVCAYRPWVRDPGLIPAEAAMEGATGYSFPSGHTMQAVGTMGVLAHEFRSKKLLRVLSVVLPLLTGLSRLYLGVHTPQDVLAGLLIGVVSVFTSVKLFDWFERDKNNDVRFMVFSLILVAALLCFVTLKSYPMDYDASGQLLVDPQVMMNDSYAFAGMLFGFSVGFAYERHFVGFSTEGISVRTRWLRFAFGAVGMAAIYFGAKHPVYDALGQHWGRFSIFAALFIFALIIYPTIFFRLENRGKRNAQ